MSSSPEYRINSLAKEREANRERLKIARVRQRAIGRELRRMFDEVALAPLPDEFQELLRRIDEVAAQNLNNPETKKTS